MVKLSNKKETANLPDNVLKVTELGNGKKEILISMADGVINNNIKKLTAGKVIDRRDSVDFALRVHNSQFRDYLWNTDSYTMSNINIPTDPHEIMELATELYWNDPLLGTVIDIMVEMSSSGFQNQCSDSKIKEFYDKLCKDLDMDQVIKWIFLEYYRTGNVHIYKDLDINGIPNGYTVLNPLHVYVDGSLLFNQNILRLKINKDLRELINNDNPYAKELLKNLPDEIVRTIKAGRMDKIPLNPKNVSSIYWKKQPYEKYAKPLLHRVFAPALFKQKLIEMDCAIADMLIRQLILVKVGNNEYPATSEDIEKVAELFNTPSMAPTLVWNHAIEISVIKPEGLDTLNDEKYKEVNTSLIMGIGFPEVLVTGKGSSFASSWTSILTVIQRLEYGRQEVKRWLEREYKIIAETMGFKTYPTVKFDEMTLRQDTFFKTVMLTLYDRGLLSRSTLLDFVGLDIENEAEYLQLEKEKYEEVFVPPQLPFSGQTNNNFGPKNKGRPPGKDSKTYERSPEDETTPQGGGKTRAEIKDEYLNELEKLYDDTKKDIVKLIFQQDIIGNTNYPMVLSVLRSWAYLMKSLGDKYMFEAYDKKYSSLSNSEQSVTKKMQLQSWNEKYIDRFYQQIATKIKNLESLNAEVDKLIVMIENIFEEERYRLELYSKEGIKQSQWYAEIHAMKELSKKKAVWNCRFTENSCNKCKSMHGEKFVIDNVPDRPHVGCECFLTYE